MESNDHSAQNQEGVQPRAPQALERLVDGLTTEPYKLAAAAAAATATAAAAERAAAAVAAAAAAAPSDDDARARSAAASQEATSAAGRAREAVAAAGAAPVPAAAEDERVTLLLQRVLLPQCKARLGEPNLAVRQVRCAESQCLLVGASLGSVIRTTGNPVVIPPVRTADALFDVASYQSWLIVLRISADVMLDSLPSCC